MLLYSIVPVLAVSALPNYFLVFDSTRNLAVNSILLIGFFLKYLGAPLAIIYFLLKQVYFNRTLAAIYTIIMMSILYNLGLFSLIGMIVDQEILKLTPVLLTLALISTYLQLSQSDPDVKKMNMRKIRFDPQLLKDLLLDDPLLKNLDIQQAEIQNNQIQNNQIQDNLRAALENFNVPANLYLDTVSQGVMLFKLKIPRNVKISRIISIASEIEKKINVNSIRITSTPTVDSVRVVSSATVASTTVAQIYDDRNHLSIEILNDTRRPLSLKEVLSSSLLTHQNEPFLMGLGKDLYGNIFVAYLSNILICGETGSGKSTLLHSIILSLIYKNTSNNLKFILIELDKECDDNASLHLYEGIEDLLHPVISNSDDALEILGWAKTELNRRLMQLSIYKKYYGNTITIILSGIEHFKENDVLAKLIEILTKKGNLVGFYLIVTTNKPSIHSNIFQPNFPNKIIFCLLDESDRSVVADKKLGIERLLPHGDALYLRPGCEPIRIQSPFVSRDEIEKVIKSLK